MPRWLSPAGEAVWIWQPGSPRQTIPRAFFAVRDFELPERPARAELRILADEEYVVFLNGRRVGSDRYSEGDPMDRYEVGELLERGGNRLAVELRSVRGAGGLLLALRAFGEGAGEGKGNDLVVSDPSWRIFSESQPGIVEGWLPADLGEPPLVWGRPPVGRWGLPRLGAPWPRFATVAGPVGRRRPVPAVRVAAGRTVSAFSPAAAVAPVPFGSRVTFDWGREVTGYLVLALRPAAGTRTGLLFVGDRPPRGRVGEEDASVVGVAGAASWRDALPRRFRYVSVVGVEGLLGAAVEPVVPKLLPELPGLPGPPRGLLGIRPLPRRTPVEEEVGERLKSAG